MGSIRKIVRIFTSIDSFCYFSLSWGINQKCTPSFVYICCKTFYNIWKLERAVVSNSESSVKFCNPHVMPFNYVSGEMHNCNIGFFFLIIYLFLDRGEGRKRGRETSMCGCLSRAPYWGPGPQPRHVPRLGIEPTIPWFAGQCSVYWATPGRAVIQFWTKIYDARRKRMKYTKMIISILSGL